MLLMKYNFKYHCDLIIVKIAKVCVCNNFYYTVMELNNMGVSGKCYNGMGDNKISIPLMVVYSFEDTTLNSK